MNTKRTLGRFSKIALGLFGISALLSSCAKEKTCTCSVTYTYAGVSETEPAFTMTLKTKDDCDEVEMDLTQSYPGMTTSVSCKE